MANQDFLLGDIRQDHLKNGSGPVIEQRDARFQVEIFGCVSARDRCPVLLRQWGGGGARSSGPRQAPYPAETPPPPWRLTRGAACSSGGKGLPGRCPDRIRDSGDDSRAQPSLRSASFLAPGAQWKRNFFSKHRARSPPTASP